MQMQGYCPQHVDMAFFLQKNVVFCPIIWTLTQAIVYNAIGNYYRL